MAKSSRSTALTVTSVLPNNLLKLGARGRPEAN